MQKKYYKKLTSKVMYVLLTYVKHILVHEKIFKGALTITTQDNLRLKTATVKAPILSSYLLL